MKNTFILLSSMLLNVTLGGMIHTLNSTKSMVKFADWCVTNAKGDVDLDLVRRRAESAWCVWHAEND